MPPLYRVDIGKKVEYALDEEELNALMDRIESEKMTGKVSVTRFKGLGEMNPLQLRETSMDPDTRRLIQLTMHDPEKTRAVMDLLLAKKRAGDRKVWLEEKGNLAII